MSEEVDQDASTSFFRQRRDLLVISALLALAQLADLRIDRLSFLGTEIAVENASVLITAGWLLWFYWLVRYFQAFNDLPQGAVTSFFDKDFPERAKAASLPHAKAETSAALRARPPDEVWYAGEPGDAVYHGQPKSSFTVKWQLRLFNDKGDADNLGEFTENFSGRKLKRLRRRVWLYAIFRTKMFTEYLFPPVFALFPLAIAVLR